MKKGMWSKFLFITVILMTSKTWSFELAEGGPELKVAQITNQTDMLLGVRGGVSSFDDWVFGGAGFNLVAPAIITNNNAQADLMLGYMGATVGGEAFGGKNMFPSLVMFSGWG